MMRDKTLNDEEDNMEFRSNSLNLLNQISKHECAVEIQKYLTVESNLLKNPMDFQTIRRKIETGATTTFTTIQKDLSRLLCNAIIANAASDKIGELAVAVMAVYKKEEKKIRESARKRASPRKKIIMRFRKLTNIQNRLSDSKVVEYSSEILTSPAASHFDNKNIWKPSGRKKSRLSDSETSSVRFAFGKTTRVTRASAISLKQEGTHSGQSEGNHKRITGHHLREQGKSLHYAKSTYLS